MITLSENTIENTSSSVCIRILYHDVGCIQLPILDPRAKRLPRSLEHEVGPAQRLTTVGPTQLSQPEAGQLHVLIH